MDKKAGNPPLFYFPIIPSEEKICKNMKKLDFEPICGYTNLVIDRI
ncbi:hypothetical protein CHCC20348_1279 [Bacillus paralicheniformis]|nr:hypothetical protein CHCC20348_1279 [Bacillus paralicheniformis]